MTMGLDLTCSMLTSYLEFFNDCTAIKCSRAQALALHWPREFLLNMAARLELNLSWGRAQLFILVYPFIKWKKLIQRRIIKPFQYLIMINNNDAEILLVEDNIDDAEMTIRALKKILANSIVHLEDGQEALDYLFGKGKYIGRNLSMNPKVILLDIKM